MPALGAFDRSCSLVAPAGHGKTFEIVTAVVSDPSRRVLVLTHTNAGTQLVRRRVHEKGIPYPNARIETIATFSRRLSSIAGSTSDVSGEADWLAVEADALATLQRTSVLKLIAASYDLVLVDEVQDCSANQMALIELLAASVTTVILGDPMQSIFDFDKRVGWSGPSDTFPSVGELPNPHRWLTSAPDLGAWIYRTRSNLESGSGLPLDDGPFTTWELARPAAQGGLDRLIGRLQGQVLVVAPQPDVPAAVVGIARAHARQLNVIETVDLADALVFARKFDAAKTPFAELLALIDFVSKSTTSIKTGQGVLSVIKNSQVESLSRTRAPIGTLAANYVASEPTFRARIARQFIMELVRSGGYTYRPDLLRTVLEALVGIGGDARTLEDATKRGVEARRRAAWAPTVRQGGVGTTLRVKGLEFENVIVLEPDLIPSKEHLYVAISRASRRLIFAVDPTRGFGRWA